MTKHLKRYIDQYNKPNCIYNTHKQESDTEQNGKNSKRISTESHFSANGKTTSGQREKKIRSRNKYHLYKRIGFRYFYKRI